MYNARAHVYREIAKEEERGGERVGKKKGEGGVPRDSNLLWKIMRRGGRKGEKSCKKW